MLPLCLLLLAAAPSQSTVALTVRDLPLPALAEGGARMPPARWQVLEIAHAPEAVGRALDEWLRPLALTEKDADQVRGDPCFSQELSWHAERGLLSIKLERASCDGAYPWASTQYLTLNAATGARARLRDLLSPAGRDFVMRAIESHLDHARERAVADTLANEEHGSAADAGARRVRSEVLAEVGSVFEQGCYSPLKSKSDPFFVVGEQGLEIALCSFPHAVQAWAPPPLGLSWKQLSAFLATEAP